jgi:hypothetical protein
VRFHFIGGSIARLRPYLKDSTLIEA